MPDERDVVVRDPGLSPEANRALTDEVREVVGSERVPAADAGDGPATLPGRTQKTFVAAIAQNRLVIALGLFVVLLLAVIFALATGSWLVVGAAVFLHALVTVAWAFIFIRLASEPEHASASTAAALEDEGVADPDAQVEELARGFQGRREARAGSAPADDGSTVADSAPSLMIWLPAVGLLAVSAIAPFVTDGQGLWLLPVVMWPAVLLWLAFAWGKPKGLADAFTQRPAPLGGAVALAALGLVLVMIGVITW